jgi:hypothetical protein
LKKSESIPQSITNTASAPTGWPDGMADEAMCGVAGDFVRTVEPWTESDPAALLVQLYVGFGNLIGSGPHLMVEKTRHGMNLFAGIVGDTAKARKGTSWDHAANTLGEVDPVWAKTRVESGLSSGEGLIAHVRDGTSPGDSGVADKRVLAFEGDFSRILKAMSRTGNTLSPIMRKCWDSGDLRVITKNSPLRATGAHVSIIVQTVQFELDENLGPADIFGGLGNRFLWICARRSKFLPFAGQVPADDLRDITDRLKNAADFARGIGRLKLSPKASELWAKEYMKLSTGESGQLGAMTSRAEPQVLRLAGICALMNESDEIQKKHLRAGLAIWDYSFASARYLFGGRSRVTLDEKLRRILQAAPAGLTRTEISAALNHHHTGDAIASALERLQEKEIATPQKQSTKGRTAERWLAVSKKDA